MYDAGKESVPTRGLIGFAFFFYVKFNLSNQSLDDIGLAPCTKGKTAFTQNNHANSKKEKKKKTISVPTD